MNEVDQLANMLNMRLQALQLALNDYIITANMSIAEQRRQIAASTEKINNLEKDKSERTKPN